MSTRQVCFMFISLVLLLTYCSSERVDTAQSVENDSVENDMEKTHYGGCILLEKSSAAPDDLYMNTGVVQANEYPPFTKKISVYGYTLVGRNDITDDFMQRVAQTITETLPRGDAIDEMLQKEFIRNMYEYNALIPFYKGTDRITDPQELAVWNITRSQNSVCDVIMEAPEPGQVNEVFEHILHYANDVGLHYTFPEEWAVTTDSQLYQFMREAIDKGYYNIRSDIDSENGDRRVRGLLQEFGYWVISTAWNLQEPYGPGIEEWTIRNRADLQAKMPELYAMYEQTVGKIMASPSLATLDTFNP